MEINGRTEGRIRPCAILSQLHRQRFTDTTVHARTCTHDTYNVQVYVTRSTLPVSGWFVLCRIRAIIFNTERVKAYVLLQSRRNPRMLLFPGKNQVNFTVHSFYVTVVFFYKRYDNTKKKFVQQSSSLHLKIFLLD